MVERLKIGDKIYRVKKVPNLVENDNARASISYRRLLIEQSLDLDILITPL